MKPSLPQGTRDFPPDIVRKRKYIFDTIVSVFELYGFEPLETPAMENLDTLMGKYGEEGDKLIFKILNNGLDNPAKKEASLEGFNKILEGKNNKAITERALRYDLTIPFARFISMNYGKLTLPFKRYQVQPVWRADRPQKGRYREFFQCDADIAGSASLLHDTELALIYVEVFKKLKLPVVVKINSRKILQALTEATTDPSRIFDITTAIDKLDKVGIDKVLDELKEKQLNEDSITVVKQYLEVTGTNTEKISAIKELLKTTNSIESGIEEVQYLVDMTNAGDTLEFDPTLARGLNYYTGIIYEVKARNVQMGSIGGGGRYDDLTGLFGVPNLPGVGISFGIDRIYDVLEELDLFPEKVHKGTQVLFFNLGKKESEYAFGLMQQLRNDGIACELYHETAKMDKQFRYAERKNIKWAIIIGSREMELEQLVIKNLESGVQETKGFREIRASL